MCGDPFLQLPRPHEVGGQYATGRIVRFYQSNSIIDIHILVRVFFISKNAKNIFYENNIKLTANHLGYMEFRLCPVNNPKIEATHECLNKNVLEIIGYGTRYKVTQDDRDLNFKYF